MPARRTNWMVLALGAAAAGAIGWAALDVRRAIGKRPRGVRAARVRRSPHYGDGGFQNPLATRTVLAESGRRMFREFLLEGHKRRPPGAVPLGRPGSGTQDGLHVTWYGHASALIEIDGQRVLLDPIWSSRCSPSRLVGPKRLHPVPVPLTDLPAIDAIVISHDHYDHLDRDTVRQLVRVQSAPFVVPLGVGALLAGWGVPAGRIIELDWDERVVVQGIEVTATAARHFSGRGFTRNRTQWASWIIAAHGRRVFYTGDSGYFPGYRDIGDRYGPFDAALVQIGAYDAAWPDIHMFPEDAVTAHLELGGGLLIPVHWATFDLARHTWAEPVDRLWREAKARDVRLAVPRPGERIWVDDPPPVDGWWQTGV